MKQDLSIFNLSSFWLFFRYCVTATICMENGTSAKSERYFLDDICYKIRPSKYFWHLEVRNQPIYFSFVSKKDSLLQKHKETYFLRVFSNWIQFNSKNIFSFVYQWKNLVTCKLIILFHFIIVVLYVSIKCFWKGEK